MAYLISLLNIKRPKASEVLSVLWLMDVKSLLKLH